MVILSHHLGDYKNEHGDSSTSDLKHSASPNPNVSSKDTGADKLTFKVDTGGEARDASISDWITELMMDKVSPLEEQVEERDASISTSTELMTDSILQEDEAELEVDADDDESDGNEERDSVFKEQTTDKAMLREEKTSKNQNDVNNMLQEDEAGGAVDDDGNTDDDADGEHSVFSAVYGEVDLEELSSFDDSIVSDDDDEATQVTYATQATLDDDTVAISQEDVAAARANAMAALVRTMALRKAKTGEIECIAAPRFKRPPKSRALRRQSKNNKEMEGIAAPQLRRNPSPFHDRLALQETKSLALRRHSKNNKELEGITAHRDDSPFRDRLALQETQPLMVRSDTSDPKEVKGPSRRPSLLHERLSAHHTHATASKLSSKAETKDCTPFYSFIRSDSFDAQEVSSMSMLPDANPMQHPRRATSLPTGASPLHERVAMPHTLSTMQKQSPLVPKMTSPSPTRSVSKMRSESPARLGLGLYTVGPRNSAPTPPRPRRVATPRRVG